MLPPALAVLFSHEDGFWTEVAAYHGQTLDEYREELADLFEPMLNPSEERSLYVFRCSGCGTTDITVWPKVGVQHWRRGGGEEPFEVACGVWQPCGRAGR